MKKPMASTPTRSEGDRLARDKVRALRLVAFADGERHAVTSRVRAAFTEAGSWITDVHFFSGLQTVIALEVAPARVSALVAALERAGLEFDDESRAAVAWAAQAPEESLEGTLVVIFREGDPNLRHPVPAVPG